MSRAFVKEDTGDLEPLPDIPVSPHPNLVTPRGLAHLKDRLTETQTRLAALRARAERLDKLPEAAAERDIRYLEARLRSAILIDPAGHDLTEVAFGLAVRLADDDGAERTYQIVGEDEADIKNGKLSVASPMARALIGKYAGDVAQVQAPGGIREFEIIDVRYE